LYGFSQYDPTARKSLANRKGILDDSKKKQEDLMGNDAELSPRARRLAELLMF
jgi:hypothetical protein